MKAQVLVSLKSVLKYRVRVFHLIIGSEWKNPSPANAVPDCSVVIQVCPQGMLSFSNYCNFLYEGNPCTLNDKECRFLWLADSAATWTSKNMIYVYHKLSSFLVWYLVYLLQFEIACDSHYVTGLSLTLCIFECELRKRDGGRSPLGGGSKTVECTSSAQLAKQDCCYI